jgi:hypothetical protein
VARLVTPVVSSDHLPSGNRLDVIDVGLHRHCLKGVRPGHALDDIVVANGVGTY